MIALAIIIGVILLIALLRFGVSVEYSQEGTLALLHIGPISLTIYPKKKNPKKEEKKAKKKADKKAKKEDKKANKSKKKEAPKLKYGGSYTDFLEVFPRLAKMLSRLKHRILIKRLIIRLTIAGEDASKTAMNYGYANAGLSALSPVLENNFRVRYYDFKTAVDFIETKPTIYLNVRFSLAIWEVIYITIALFPLVRFIFRLRPSKKGGKEVKEDGKTSN